MTDFDHVPFENAGTRIVLTPEKWESIQRELSSLRGEVVALKRQAAEKVREELIRELVAALEVCRRSLNNIVCRQQLIGYGVELHDAESALAKAKKVMG